MCVCQVLPLFVSNILYLYNNRTQNYQTTRTNPRSKLNDFCSFGFNDRRQLVLLTVALAHWSCSSWSCCWLTGPAYSGAGSLVLPTTTLTHWSCSSLSCLRWSGDTTVRSFCSSSETCPEGSQQELHYHIYFHYHYVYMHSPYRHIYHYYYDHIFGRDLY